MGDPESVAAAGGSLPPAGRPTALAGAEDSDADSSDGLTGAARPFARQLHPLPPGLVELYGLLAVLVVLVPEWMASGALFGFREVRRGSALPPASGAWRRLPELRLAAMGLAELRLLAQQRRLWGYARDSRSTLTARLLHSLQRRP